MSSELTEPNNSPSPSETAHAREWHYVIDDTPYGPTTRAALEDMAMRKLIDPSTLIWREGWDDWQPLAGIPALADIAAVSSPLPSFADANPTPPPPRVQIVRTNSALELILLRFAAAIIDQAILFIPTMFVSMPVVASVLGPSPSISQMMQLGPADPGCWLIVLSVWVPQWVYYSLLESSAAMATIGKRVCGLCVTDMHGNRLSFARASLRYWGKLASSFVLMFGHVVGLFTRGHRTMHDFIAGTAVFQRRR